MVLQAKFYDSTIIAEVDLNQNGASQYNDIFSYPDYIQKEKSGIELVVDNQISEHEIIINRTKKIKMNPSMMKKNPSTIMTNKMKNKTTKNDILKMIVKQL